MRKWILKHLFKKEMEILQNIINKQQNRIKNLQERLIEIRSTTYEK